MDATANAIISHGKKLESADNNRLAILSKNGDPDALEQLVYSNILLIWKLVKKYSSQYSVLEEDDLIQDGILGLLRALSTYDSEKSSFSTHAFHWVNAMLLAACKRKEPFYYEANFYQKMIRFKKLKTAVGCADNVFTENELKDFSLTKSDIELIVKYERQTCSFDELREQEESYLDPSKILYNPDDDVEKKVLRKIQAEIIDLELKRLLTKSEQRIIALTFGLYDEPITKVNLIAKEMGVSRQQIYNLKTSAMKKLNGSDILRDLYK